MLIVHMRCYKLVFGHCDLLGPNVVIHPLRDNEPPRVAEAVTFIDYE